MTQVTSGVFVGDMALASDKARLRRYNISHILVVANNMPAFFADDSSYSYLVHPVHDTEDERIFKLFSPCCAFVENARRRGRVVLIHCHAGTSRSVAFAAAYLMAKHRMTADQALDDIRERIPDAAPNPGFVRQLRRLEVHLRTTVWSKQPLPAQPVQQEQQPVSQTRTCPPNCRGKHRGPCGPTVSHSGQSPASSSVSIESTSTDTRSIESTSTETISIETTEIETSSTEIETSIETSIETIPTTSIEIETTSTETTSIEIETTSTETTSIEIETTSTETTSIEIETTSTETTSIEIETTSIEIETVPSPSDDSELIPARKFDASTCYRCRSCRMPLFDETDIIPHSQHETGLNFGKSWNKLHAGKSGAPRTCNSFFVDVLPWMHAPPMNGLDQVEGKLQCAKCGYRLGTWVWNGSQCSCGFWSTPAIQINQSRVDRPVPASQLMKLTVSSIN